MSRRKRLVAPDAKNDNKKKPPLQLVVELRVVEIILLRGCPIPGSIPPGRVAVRVAVRVARRLRGARRGSARARRRAPRRDVLLTGSLGRPRGARTRRGDAAGARARVPGARGGAAAARGAARRRAARDVRARTRGGDRYPGVRARPRGAALCRDDAPQEGRRATRRGDRSRTRRAESGSRRQRVLRRVVPVARVFGRLAPREGDDFYGVEKRREREKHSSGSFRCFARDGSRGRRSRRSTRDRR